MSAPSLNLSVLAEFAKSLNEIDFGQQLEGQNVARLCSDIVRDPNKCRVPPDLLQFPRAERDRLVRNFHISVLYNHLKNYRERQTRSRRQQQEEDEELRLALEQIALMEKSTKPTVSLSPTGRTGGPLRSTTILTKPIPKATCSLQMQTVRTGCLQSPPWMSVECGGGGDCQFLSVLNALQSAVDIRTLRNGMSEWSLENVRAVAALEAFEDELEDQILNYNAEYSVLHESVVPSWWTSADGDPKPRDLRNAIATPGADFLGDNFTLSLLGRAFNVDFWVVDEDRLDIIHIPSLLTRFENLCDSKINQSLYGCPFLSGSNEEKVDRSPAVSCTRDLLALWNTVFRGDLSEYRNDLPGPELCQRLRQGVMDHLRRTTGRFLGHIVLLYLRNVGHYQLLLKRDGNQCQSLFEELPSEIVDCMLQFQRSKRADVGAWVLEILNGYAIDFLHAERIHPEDDKELAAVLAVRFSIPSVDVVLDQWLEILSKLFVVAIESRLPMTFREALENNHLMLWRLLKGKEYWQFPSAEKFVDTWLWQNLVKTVDENLQEFKESQPEDLYSLLLKETSTEKWRTEIVPILNRIKSTLPSRFKTRQYLRAIANEIRFD